MNFYMAMVDTKAHKLGTATCKLDNHITKLVNNDGYADTMYVVMKTLNVIFLPNFVELVIVSPVPFHFQMSAARL